MSCLRRMSERRPPPPRPPPPRPPPPKPPPRPPPPKPPPIPPRLIAPRLAKAALAPPILIPPMAELPGRLMFGRPAGRLAGLAAGRAPPPGRPAGRLAACPPPRPNPPRATGATHAAASPRPANPARTASTTNAPWSPRPPDPTRPVGADSRLAAHPGPIVAVGPPRLHIVVDVDVIADIDVAVIDAAIPARLAGPGWRIDRACSPIPIIVVPQRPDRDACAEAQERRDPCIGLVDCGGVISRDIDRRWIGRLDGDIARRGLGRCRPPGRAGPWRRARLHAFNGLLIGRLKRPGCFRLGAKVLDDFGDVLRLVHFGVAEVGRPIEIGAHQLDDARKARQRLHRGIPILIVDAGIIVLGDERLVLIKPALRLDDLHGIGARWQHLRQQGVGIKRNWSKQLLE